MVIARKAHRALAGMVSLAVLGLITAAAKAGTGTNAITVALLYLLVVLATAAVAEVTCGSTPRHGHP